MRTFCTENEIKKDRVPKNAASGKKPSPGTYATLRARHCFAISLVLMYSGSSTQVNRPPLGWVNFASGGNSRSMVAIMTSRRLR